MSAGYTKRYTCGVYISDMKSKIILIVSVVGSLAVGFLAGHFQAANSWKHKLYDGFYSECGVDAFVYSGVLSDLRGGNKDAALTTLEDHLDLSLARLQPLIGQQRNSVVEYGIRRARNYRLEHPWHDSSPRLEEASASVLATSK
jgi:hypothetical protein